MQAREAIEYFHLMFCQRLAGKIDKSLFCLKGGCNLRFFFRSIRYSEDIDFDVHTISVATLKMNVEKILIDSTFSSLLRTNLGIEIVDWSCAKQTSTTQRWKVSLRLKEQAMLLPTKIEFSRRRSDIEGSEISLVHHDLITKYKLQMILLNHYQVAKAIDQKLQALINRTETQARDIIDLQILKNQLRPEIIISLPPLDKAKALDILMSVSFDDYKSQVWPYLLPEYQDYFASPKAWSKIQDEVVRFIEEQTDVKHELN